MRGLLVKIFLWFWLALALLATVTVLTIVMFENGPFFATLRALIRNAMTSYAAQAVVVYERDGATAAARFLDDLEHAAGIQVTLLDARRQSVTGREAVPRGDAELLALTQQALQQGETIYRNQRWVVRLAIPQRSARGAQYCFAAYLPASYTQKWRPTTRAIFWRLLAALVVAAAVCFGLARHLTRPLVQLQQATRQIAAGDLTARVSPQLAQRRDEIARLAQDFNEMADRVAALLDGQRRMLGDISHELRSPLTRLNISAALARDAVNDGDRELAQAELDRIELEAERLNELIGQLLTLTRLESSGATTADYESMQLAELLSDIAADADFEARSRNRSVVFQQTAEAVLNAPPALLRSAIENVVRNAVRYTAENTAVQIDLEHTATHFVIRVNDHGPGVPETALTKLFEKFYRLDEARDRESGGAGLGLAITARVITSLHGYVAARNLPQGGLCVELHLPRSLAHSH
jgi:two-component system sensor histidine kinase CpxA